MAIAPRMSVELAVAAVPALEPASREVDPQLQERARAALRHIRDG